MWRYIEYLVAMIGSVKAISARLCLAVLLYSACHVYFEQINKYKTFTKHLRKLVYAKWRLQRRAFTMSTVFKSSDVSSTWATGTVLFEPLTLNRWGATQRDDETLHKLDCCFCWCGDAAAGAALATDAVSGATYLTGWLHTQRKSTLHYDQIAKRFVYFHLILCCTPCTSAPVERVFSHVDRIRCDQVIIN